MRTKLSFLLLATPLLLISCEGSRPRRMYDTLKYAHDEYEETGDPTTLIIIILLLLVAGIFWLWSKKKDR